VAAVVEMLPHLNSVFAITKPSNHIDPIPIIEMLIRLPRILFYCPIWQCLAPSGTKVEKAYNKLGAQ
jgi:hypothetical protein